MPMLYNSGDADDADDADDDEDEEEDTKQCTKSPIPEIS